MFHIIMPFVGKLFLVYLGVYVQQFVIYMFPEERGNTVAKIMFWLTALGAIVLFFKNSVLLTEFKLEEAGTYLALVMGISAFRQGKKLLEQYRWLVLAISGAADIAVTLLILNRG